MCAVSGQHIRSFGLSERDRDIKNATKRAEMLKIDQFIGITAQQIMHYFNSTQWKHSISIFALTVAVKKELFRRAIPFLETLSQMLFFAVQINNKSKTVIIYP